MNQQEMFGGAVWLTAADCQTRDILMLRGTFALGKVRKATLRVLGLGFFHCHLNGRRVGEELFLPLNSEFEPRADWPVEERLTGYHTYVPEWDVTDWLQEGENVISLHFGGGWYCDTPDRPYGGPKAIWRIFGEEENGAAFEAVSSVEDRICHSFVQNYCFVRQEEQDYNVPPCVLNAGDAGNNWPHAIPARAPQTEYAFSDCPVDRAIRQLPVKPIGVMEQAVVYDCGCNTTGYPMLRLTGPKGARVEVVFSEEKTADGALDLKFHHGQRMAFVSDGTQRVVQPLFTWFGFRYFSVEGEAEVLGVQVVHAAVAVTASFETDQPLLNWIHDTWLNTQLTNLHAGIPSDCPHIERRGYTGDGQLACHAAMNVLDAQSLYRKWMQDIADTQDALSGHIQYTAPYVRSGGGPGGWGCAIVEVPWQFYRHYGDVSVLKQYYPAMLRYFDYLESHSCADLVISDKEGEWCLGDWCPPVSVVLPAPFVNNYFYIKSLERCAAIARLTGHEDDIPLFESRIRAHKQALMNAYFNKWDGNFLGNVQGANAFMTDIGLGDERTYANLVQHYRALGRFDTGIFGTDLVTRVLFERGDGQLAVNLLLSEEDTSYDGMRRRGATTLWEYWPGSLEDRSHNHPMFGAAAAYLYDYLMGVRAQNACAAYSAIVIAPVLVEQVGRLRGWRTLPAGRVCVAYEKKDGQVRFDIRLPEGLPAELVYEGAGYALHAGENRLCFPCKM